MSRKIKIIFTLSILLNIIFIGLIAGGSYRIYKHFGGEFRKELSSLPADVQTRIDQAYTESRQEMRSLFREARETKQDVRDALNEEIFNAQKYQDATSKLNQIRYRMMQEQAKKTGVIASELDAENRRKFAGYLMRGGRKAGTFLRQNRQDTKNQMSNAEPVQKEPEQVAPVQEAPFDPVMLPMPDF